MQISSIETQLYFTDKSSYMFPLKTLAIIGWLQQYNKEMLTVSLVFRDLEPYKRNVTQCK